MRFRLVLLISMSLAGPPASSAVYRCVGEQGEPAFSQHPCDGAAVTLVGDRPKPSTSPRGRGLRPSERTWLEQRRADKRASGESVRRPARATSSKSEMARQAYRCQRKRRDLEALNARLRRGYKASQAPGLHRRQQAYRDYLDAFCS